MIANWFGSARIAACVGAGAGISKTNPANIFRGVLQCRADCRVVRGGMVKVRIKIERKDFGSQ
jgi:hypothetical protein